jgi:uncharacterized protein YlxW (UPF0749 family)
MVEDHGEAAQRAALQEEKSKLNHAAERLAKLVEELQSTAGEAADPSYEDDDETMHSEASHYDVGGSFH